MAFPIEMGAGGVPGSPSAANPIAGKDLLAQLLGLWEKQNRGTQSMSTSERFNPGQLYQKYRPPGQMQVRFPWARPNRAT